MNRRQFTGGAITLSFTLAVPGLAAVASQSAEIRRDRYGVPYISGSSDAACCYALGYAQAEDGFAHLEDNFIRSLGRGAEVHGESVLRDDELVRALEIPRLGREEYDRSSPQMRALYDSYAAGIRRYVADNGPERAMSFEFEPWLTLAFVRYKYYILEFLGYAGLDRAAAQFDPAPFTERVTGSNAWAVAPAKSASGHAMLLINPHIGFFGPGQYYESDLRSEEGLHFHGTGRYGLPFPYMGHSPHLGWAYTDNYPDHGDLYIEHFDDPADPLAYRYGDGYRRAESWTEEMRMRVEGGVPVTRRHSFTKTHHGPIVGEHEGKPLAVRLAKLEEGGWFDQWYAMLRARSLGEFRAAMAMGNIPYMNTTYADRDGNIYYVYNGVVPIRLRDFDWRRPVDGSDPRTEWQGFHPLDDLPQILNPASSYVQNCNSTPFATTSGIRPEGDFPAYMIGPEEDNPRARRSRQILEAADKFSFEDWAEAATDNRMLMPDEELPALFAGWRALDESDPLRTDLSPLIEALESWDRRAAIDSVGATLFVRWFEKRMQEEDPDVAQRLAWLGEVKAGLIADWGDWCVPWGEVNRLQAAHWSGLEGFDDDAPSVPVAGAPGWTGVIFNFYTADPDGTRRRYGRAGNSYVSVIEFGDTVRARSIKVLGQATDADSEHRSDQAELYARGDFRPVLQSDAEVAAASESAQRFDSLD